MGCLRKGTSSSLINNGLSARPVRPTNHASRSVSPVSLSARLVRPTNHASRSVSPVSLSARPVRPTNHASRSVSPVSLSARPVRPTNHARWSASSVSLTCQTNKPCQVVCQLSQPDLSDQQTMPARDCHASPRLPGQPRAVGLAPYTLQKKRLRWNASIPRWALFTACMACSLFILCDIVDEAFGVFPAEAGICDGFAVNAASNLLVSFNDIAFDHHTFYQLVDVRT